MLTFFFFSWRPTAVKLFYWRKQGMRRRKISGAVIPSFPTLVFLSLLDTESISPSSLAGRYDHVTRLWPMDVSRNDVCPSQVWSITTSEISLFLSLADGGRREFFQGHGRGKSHKMENSLGPWLIAWKEVCKAGTPAQTLTWAGNKQYSGLICYSRECYSNAKPEVWRMELVIEFLIREKSL